MHPLLHPTRNKALSSHRWIDRPSSNPQTSFGTPTIKAVMIFAKNFPPNSIALCVDLAFVL